TRLRDRRYFLAAYGIRGGGLLYHRNGGSFIEFGALRRRSLYTSFSGCNGRGRSLFQEPSRRIRSGSEATDSFGNVCVEQRLLRRLLFAGAKSKDADPERFYAGI